MEKMGLIKNTQRMGKYELEKGFASYKTIVDYYIGDLVLCNNIIDVDCSIYDNMQGGLKYIDYRTGEEKTEKEYQEDETGTIEIECPEIYQYYLCNLSNYEKEQCLKSGLIISYSDLLGCDILCVNHFGTSWDYVLTDVKLFDNYEDLEKWESEEQENE